MASLDLKYNVSTLINLKDIRHTFIFSSSTHYCPIHICLLTEKIELVKKQAEFYLNSTEGLMTYGSMSFAVSIKSLSSLIGGL